MPDETTTELAAKGRRVIGTFVAMLGAGMIVDAHVMWIGVPVMLIGAVLVAWGLVAPRAHAAIAANAHGGVGARIVETPESDA